MPRLDDLASPLARDVAQGTLAALEADWQGTAGQRGEAAWRRVWAPSPGSNVAGNSISFLRYLTRDPSAALQVDCPLAYSLTLDRLVTAPNAVVGVGFGAKPSSQRSTWHLLFPGETVPMPAGFTRFWIWNADEVSGSSVELPIGYCGFLLGLRPGLFPPVQPAPHPRARVFHVMRVPFDGSAIRFNAGALRGMEVRTVALSAANVVLGTPCAYTAYAELYTFDRTADPDVGKETFDEPTPTTATSAGEGYRAACTVGGGSVTRRDSKMRIPLRPGQGHILIPGGGHGGASWTQWDAGTAIGSLRWFLYG